MSTIGQLYKPDSLYWRHQTDCDSSVNTKCNGIQFQAGRGIFLSVVIGRIQKLAQYPIQWIPGFHFPAVKAARSSSCQLISI